MKCSALFGSIASMVHGRSVPLTVVQSIAVALRIVPMKTWPPRHPPRTEFSSIAPLPSYSETVRYPARPHPPGPTQLQLPPATGWLAMPQSLFQEWWLGGWGERGGWGVRDKDIAQD